MVLPQRFRLIRSVPRTALCLSTWEAPPTLHLENESEMIEAMQQIEAKMLEALQFRDTTNVTNTRKEVSQWMEKYASTVDRLNSEQRSEVYRKYGSYIDRLKVQLLQLYKIRDY
jgi:hypothetical protein